MTTADDKVTSLPTLLERLGLRIDQAWQRSRSGEVEWVEGSLELAQALAEGRGRFPSNVAFGDWLHDNKHDHVGKNDRAALVGMASDLVLMREVLTKSESHSYDLIWRKVRSRFPSARITKRGRPKNVRTGEDKHKSSTRKNDSPAAEAAAKLVLDTDLTLEGAGKETGAGGEWLVRVAVAREEGRREALAEVLGAAAEKFSEKGKLTIEDAIRIHKSRLDRQFEQVVNTEVRRRIDAANDAMRTNYGRLSQENLNLTRIVSQRAVFTETQYKQMLMLCHPDSSASPQTKAELLQILVENRLRLVKQ